MATTIGMYKNNIQFLFAETKSPRLHFFKMLIFINPFLVHRYFVVRIGHRFYENYPAYFKSQSGAKTSYFIMRYA